MRVLGISGSLRRDSHNTELLRAAATLLPSGTEFEIYDGLQEIPPFDEDHEGEAPLAVHRLREEIGAADAVLFATPEYNHSIPGHLKNALDWVSRPYATNTLRNKPVAVMGASTGMFGAVWAQAELRKVLRTMGASVLEAGLSVPAAQSAFTAEGRLREPELARALRRIVHELLEETVERAA